MREKNLGEKRIKVAVKTDIFLSNIWDPPDPTPPPLQRGSPPALSLSSSLSLTSPPELPPPTQALTPSLHFFQNPSSRKGLKVCMWYHCILELISYSSIQFIFVFSEDSSRIWCLLVFLVEAQGTPAFFLFRAFPPSTDGLQAQQSILGESPRLPWHRRMFWLDESWVWSFGCKVLEFLSFGAKMRIWVSFELGIVLLGWWVSSRLYKLSQTCFSLFWRISQIKSAEIPSLK